VSTKFHHGDLKAALLRLAATELEAGGHEQISLRGLAAKAGVSTAAPYKHFASRRALIQALVDDGIERLAKRYIASAHADAAPVERLRMACLAYIEFAEQQPQRFRLIFVSDIFLELPHASADETYRIFEDLIGDVLGCDDLEARQFATLSCWSMIHGFAMLQISNRLPKPLDYARAKDALVNSAIANLTFAPQETPIR
jgi:AcrR family transcriptional regulator